jgi:hypothetical protein
VYRATCRSDAVRTLSPAADISSACYGMALKLLAIAMRRGSKLDIDLRSVLGCGVAVVNDFCFTDTFADSRRDTASSHDLAVFCFPVSSVRSRLTFSPFDAPKPFGQQA